MKRRFRSAALFVLALLAGSGCAQRSVIPGISGTLVSAETAKAVQQDLDACDSRVQTFRSLFRVAVRQGDDNAAFRYALVFQKPDNLRLEALPVAAVYTLSLLVSGEGRFLYLEPAEKTALRGVADGSMLGRYLGVRLEPSDLMSLLTACVPARYRADEREMYLDEGRNLLQIRGKSMYLEAQAEALQPQRLVVVSPLDEREAMEVRWGAFTEIGGVDVPQSIEIFVPKYRLTVALSHGAPRLNEELRPGLFTVEIPADFTLKEERE